MKVLCRCTLAAFAALSAPSCAPADAAADVREARPQADGATELPADVRARIDAELETLFGTFEAPRYARLDDWSATNFDPLRDAFGPSDLADAREEFARSARARYASELERARAGDFESVHLPEYALATLLEIHDLAISAPRERRDAATRAAVEDRIVTWYPTLAEARSLYHVHCETCHGARGGGDGPTAFGHDPRPRDFTSSTFKFTTGVSRAKPTRADLLRTLTDGLDGTGMASYAMLSRAELEGAIDWVRWLALRAAVERELVATWELEDELPDGAAAEAYASSWASWRSAEAKAVPVPSPTPAATPERVARGRELFLDARKGNCAQCHGEQGRGDGPASFTEAPDGSRVSIQDDWGHAIRPRNLVEGKFRGGRRPEDVFRRIYAGINGTPMPALGDTTDANGARVVGDDEIWDLALYALSLKQP
jgi:mono/diheme cytochrome c family protein